MFIQRFLRQQGQNALRLSETLCPFLFRSKLCEQPFGHSVLFSLGQPVNGIKSFLEQIRH